jgi:DNA-binding XRE family transcriptional regulator
MLLFTLEELEELRRADEEIEREFRWTNEELAESRERDREAVLDQMDGKTRGVAERNKAYYETNRERLAERRKAYREANRERVAEYQKAYREANRERMAEYQKAYREANREKLAENKKAYYEANRERLAENKKAYYEANREKLAEYQKTYYEANRKKVAECQKAYYEANRENLAVRWKGAALRRLRTLAGWSQYELARLSGVSQPMISLYETGAVPFDPSIFESVLPGLSASLEDGPAIPDKEVDT